MILAVYSLLAGKWDFQFGWGLVSQVGAFNEEGEVGDCLVRLVRKIWKRVMMVLEMAVIGLQA